MAQAPPNPRRRSPWLVAVAAVTAVVVLALAAAVIVAFTWFDVSLSDGVGDRTYTPASANDVRDEYEVGVGSLKVDLSRISVDRELHVDAHVGVGDLRVIVPRDASVAVNARAKAGSVSVLGRQDDGRNARVRVGGGDQLVVDARIGAGNVEVERGG